MVLLTTEASQVHHVNGCILSHVRLFATPWPVACQAPLSMGFSRKQYWSGLLFPLPGDIPDPGIEFTSPALQAASLLLSHWGSPLPSSVITKLNNKVFTGTELSGFTSDIRCAQWIIKDSALT